MPKYFVLDTSVLLFDHNAIHNFDEHNILLPMAVLEELDQFKVGSSTLNFEAREIIRILDTLSEGKGLNEWIKLGKGKGKIKITSADRTLLKQDAEVSFGLGKNDHKIINVALAARQRYSRSQVTLVTKDINLRIKARALGLKADDYLTGKVTDLKEIKETDATFENLDAELIKRIYQHDRIPEEGILKTRKIANGYYILNNCTQSVLTRYDENSQELERVEKQYAYGIKPRNVEQTFAMDALLNPEIKLIALEGVAGTGKTLLALAAALEQKHLYETIILSRPIIPLSNRDIGFLPGNAEDKISPYMQPLWDNLRFIKSQHRESSRKSKIIDQLTDDGSIEITALTFIRGRSLSHTYFIVDEAQNLTPHEIKTIITRAGEGTKIIFTGDVHQIDTPYMDQLSNGLSYVIDRLKGNPLFAHIQLEHGERSELANLANRLL